MITMLNDIGGVVAAWLATYALHSTLLLGGAWLLNRRVALGVSRREAIWKAATIGGLITATLQSGLIGWNAAQPLGGRYALAPTAEVVSAVDRGPRFISQPEAPTDIGTAPTSVIPPAKVDSANSGIGLWLRNEAWSALFLLWFAGATVQLVRLRLRRRRMFQRLGPRFPLNDAQLWEMLESVKARARVQRTIRLSVSRNNVSPVVVSGREICLPDALLPRLSPVQCESMLAHEVAHIARRDPEWLMAYAWLEALFFFQPLNQHARKQVQSSAEYLCDDWATRHVSSRVALAQCLVEVARWMTHSPEPLPHPAMAEHGSILFSRVERLLDGSRERAHSPARLWWAVPIAVIAVTCIAPAVTRTSGFPTANFNAQEVSIADAVHQVGVGVVRFEFPARSSVCGTGVEQDGTRTIALLPDGKWLPSGRADRMALYVSDRGKLMRNDLGRDGTWTTPCKPGNGRVDLFVRNKRITNIEVTVSEPAPAIRGKLINLNVVTARTAAGYLLTLAEILDENLAERALLGAVIARDATDGTVLERLASFAGVQIAKSQPQSVTPKPTDLAGYFAVIADLKESLNTRRRYLREATYAGISTEDVIAAYDRVPDRAMRVELINWLGERRDPAVVRKLQQIVRDAVVLEEQQAALAVLAQEPQSSINPLARRFVDVRTGVARFSFPARPEACGSGVDQDGAGMFALLPTDDWYPAGAPEQAAFFSFDDDDFSRLSLSPNPSWTRNCQNGPVYVDLWMREGRITSLQISVGNPARAVSAPMLTNAGRVSSAEAASYLLSLARTAGQTIASNAILAAMLAKDVVIYPHLLDIATDDSRPERVRQAALHWVALEPAREARAALRSRTGDLPRGQTEAGERYPAAIGEFSARVGDPRQYPSLRIVLDNSQPMETRKKAIQWADNDGVDAGIIASTYDELPTELKQFLIEWMADCDQESTARKLIDIAQNDTNPDLRATARQALASHKHPLARRAARELR